MGCTGGVAPWRRDGDTGPSYYAVCPLCDNPIQIVGLFRRMISSGREEMSAAPSEEAVRQLHLRYCLTAEAAKTYFDGGFSVVVQDNYYGEALPRMLRLLQGYPVEAVVLCPSLAAVKEREEKRAKTGYTGFSPEALYDAFLAETLRVGFWLDNTSLSPAQAADAILRRCAGVNR